MIYQNKKSNAYDIRIIKNYNIKSINSIVTRFIFLLDVTLLTKKVKMSVMTIQKQKIRDKEEINFNKYTNGMFKMKKKH